MQTVRIENLEAMKAFAERLASRLHGGEVVGLVGDLGAGKTTFVQLLAAALGVKAAVKSPTFIVLQNHDTGRHVGVKRICHVDAYRLKDWRELTTIGFEEFAADPHTVSLVEWADRVPEIHRLPGYGEIVFTAGEGEERTLTLQGAFLGQNE